jgi:hypothetical protein
MKEDQDRTGAISRRYFLKAAGVAGAVGGAGLAPSLLSAEELTKGQLRPVVDAADLAITDAQLEKLAPAVNWGMGELRKLRDVEVGLGGPAPVFLPAPSKGGDGDG